MTTDERPISVFYIKKPRSYLSTNVADDRQTASWQSRLIPLHSMRWHKSYIAQTLILWSRNLVDWYLKWSTLGNWTVHDPNFNRIFIHLAARCNHPRYSWASCITTATPNGTWIIRQIICGPTLSCVNPFWTSNPGQVVDVVRSIL